MIPEAPGMACKQRQKSRRKTVVTVVKPDRNIKQEKKGKQKTENKNEKAFSKGYKKKVVQRMLFCSSTRFFSYKNAIQSTSHMARFTGLVALAIKSMTVW